MDSSWFLYDFCRIFVYLLSFSIVFSAFPMLRLKWPEAMGRSWLITTGLWRQLQADVVTHGVLMTRRPWQRSLQHFCLESGLGTEFLLAFEPKKAYNCSIFLSFSIF